MFKKLVIIFSTIVILSFSNSVFAEGGTAAEPVEGKAEEKSEALTITDVWARASIPSSSNSAAYMKINNPTNEEYVIIAATAPGAANNVELHNSFVDEKGVSRMTTIDKVVIPAKSEIEFKPGGMHVMLFDLKTNLNEGDKIEINLFFEEKQPMKIEGSVIR